jgi:hypothetical protein
MEILDCLKKKKSAFSLTYDKPHLETTMQQTKSLVPPIRPHLFTILDSLQPLLFNKRHNRSINQDLRLEATPQVYNKIAQLQSATLEAMRHLRPPTATEKTWVHFLKQ